MCWTPFIILTIIEYELQSSGGGIVDILSSLVVFLGILNAGINPILHNFCNNDFKLAFRKMLNLKYNGVAIASSMMLQSNSLSRGNIAQIVRECMSVNNIKLDPPVPLNGFSNSAPNPTNYEVDTYSNSAGFSNILTLPSEIHL